VFRLFTATVEPDGSFEFQNLPPGAGEVIGMCTGWANVPVRTRTENGELERALLQVDPADYTEEPFIVPMEPTARVAFTVTDADGRPVEGATVSAWPNVRWSVGYAMIFLKRSWNARTDILGRAVLENLPADPQVGFGVTHRHLRVAPKKERKVRYLKLASGDSKLQEVEMFAKTE
jgi:hypothetical protein